MAPKKKGSTKGKGPAVVDGLDLEDLSKEQLLQHVQRLREELDRERQERNSFQLECTRIQSCWDITRQELEEKKAELRSRDREMEEAEERHHVEIKKHEEEMARLRSDFETQAKEMDAKYNRKMEALREEMDLRRKTEIHELEERKNNQISELMVKHEGAFGDIKNYYNDITAKNMSLINLLKEQVEEMKKREIILEKEKSDVVQQNKGLTEPLQQAQEQVAELQKKLAHYDTDKESLMNSKARLKVIQKELKDLQWEHEVLEQRFSKVQAERDELYQKFTKAINEVQQKTGFKNLLLERKLQGLLSLLEQKEVELSEVVAVSHLDPSALSLVSHKLKDVLSLKNDTIQDLQLQLARVCKAHNDMLQTFEAKLTAFGIPLDNLGFQPLSFPLLGQELGQGPAGLVSVPT
ncbi:Growth arrest-specific protein 8 [Willisornis vidua]|uniref:Dynein regulatory complex subunit 4 n=1 Tax=Willisornis vidua TaxID=1566151 RepID=A0ABQ9DL74_9PASS|nr:Growth arrest-specific protein 8 [Willisornis vidua]